MRGRGEFVISYRAVREDLTDTVKIKRLQGGEGTPGRGNRRCKGSEAGPGLVGLRRPDLRKPWGWGEEFGLSSA